MGGRCYIMLVAVLHGVLLTQSVEDCSDYIETDDCEFYACVDRIMPCGVDGYALGFGWNFCRGPQNLPDIGLTSEAKEWFKGVQRCIMAAVLPHYSDIDSECEDIQEIALAAQVDCFTGSDVSGSIAKTLAFCRTVADPDNWKALLGIFKTVKESPSFPAAVISVKDATSTAVKQLQDASSKCVGMVKELGAELVQNITASVDNVRSILTNIFESKPMEAVENGADCMPLAVAHNCSFFECFERRFPCKAEYGISHVMDFELTSCREFYKEYDTFDQHGKAWLDLTQTCLMKSLEPLLNTTELYCHDLHGMLFKARLKCYVESGFCDITDDTPNRFAIDKSLKDNNYPAARSLKSGLDLLASTYYHREVLLLQRVSGYAHLLCFKENVPYQLRKLYERVKTKLGFLNFEVIANVLDKLPF